MDWCDGMNSARPRTEWATGFEPAVATALVAPSAVGRMPSTTAAAPALAVGATEGAALGADLALAAGPWDDDACSVEAILLRGPVGDREGERGVSASRA